MSDDVPRLPVEFKHPKDRPVLKRVHAYTGCQHRDFEIDESLAEVTCGICGEKLNPMWVLVRLANHETEFHRHRERYIDEMKRLSERSRTKCDHCGKMTRISHR